MAFIAAAAPALSAIGSVVSGIFGLASAVYQKNVADMNAEIAEENAKRAAEQGNRAAKEQDDLTRAAIGEQIAVQSASGLSLSSRSQVRTRNAARALGRVDALNVREEGDMRAYNYRTDAANFKAQGTGAMIGGIGGALGSFLNAGSLVGNARATRRSFASNPSPRPTSLIL